MVVLVETKSWRGYYSTFRNWFEFYNDDFLLAKMLVELLVMVLKGTRLGWLIFERGPSIELLADKPSYNCYYDLRYLGAV